MVPLSCSVRDCGRPLRVEHARAYCDRGHSFDRARSGYWNLLQPQDRRSLDAGDSRDTALARRRLYERGMHEPLAVALIDLLKRRGVARGARALDVGCGEGSLAARVASELVLDLAGVDLSAAAADLAARAFPDATWIVANADRRVPVADAVIDVVSSITARRPVGEISRVLTPRGLALVVVPAPDDLAQLREVLTGSAHELGPALGPRKELSRGFELVEELEVRSPVELDAAGLADVCRISYRGARARERARLSRIERMTVTAAWSVQLFARRGA